MGRALFASLRGSLEEAIVYHSGKATLRTHVLRVKPAPTYGPRDIRRLRRELRISQGILAAALNVSTAAVQSWEQGRRRPEGPARKLLELFQKDPEALLRPAKSRDAA